MDMQERRAEGQLGLDQAEPKSAGPESNSYLCTPVIDPSLGGGRSNPDSEVNREV